MSPGRAKRESVLGYMNSKIYTLNQLNNNLRLETEVRTAARAMMGGYFYGVPTTKVELTAQRIFELKTKTKFVVKTDRFQKMVIDEVTGEEFAQFDARGLGI